MSSAGHTPGSLANDFVNGSVSYWYRAAGFPESRLPLPGSLDVDVCIVGATARPRSTTASSTSHPMEPSSGASSRNRRRSW